MLIARTLRGEWSHLAFTAADAGGRNLPDVGWIDVGYSAYTHALKYLPTATVSLYAYVYPIIAIVPGALLLGEPFGRRVVFASLMVLTGSALAQWKSRAKTAARPPLRSGMTGRSVATTASSRRSLPG